ncbi:MAG: hypothetical protein CBC09_03045 [Cellvibrionales bacterium TMED49]|nr:hypothetical protein [Porticoccaceae bacterium]OUU39202.1 MAG: hypothetical protein CBC09_03045 [Cellvibrionales bacterium TMED49]|tara:strand:+ start:572 stop:946 length:375 start_codon:yes stop_codon:yes gene_type:complete
MPQRYFRFLFWLVFSVVLLGSFLPNKIPFPVTFNHDKFLHFAAYALLYFFAEKAYVTLYSRFFLGFVVIGFGLAIEITQNFILYRHADSFDIIANACGVLFAASLAQFYKFSKKIQESSDNVIR